MLRIMPDEFTDNELINRTYIFGCENEECIYNKDNDCELGTITLDIDGRCMQAEWEG